MSFFFLSVSSSLCSRRILSVPVFDSRGRTFPLQKQVFDDLQAHGLPRYNKEIPKGSPVLVAYTGGWSTYGNVRRLNLNVNWVVILAKLKSN